ncbi:hypothetical protein HOF56_05100 [Candidatus Peribacteria bacterium]|jgi:hypothetical protein|nr:hypothetical protein [Candidatus Peribacteria bacterium]MBT4021127.1 hypothetical protein [Candidatus Peribacteria bacterium]MBT4240717.1 hypothetical protein [Candidatus Peribacteria bacterium]MBT4474381.1 hypothetical protein [Candidatus Peribacteria bacterium]
MDLPKPSAREDIKDWFFREAPPHSIALFRIVFGISLMYAWAPRALEASPYLTVFMMIMLLFVTVGWFMNFAALICAFIYLYVSLSLNFANSILEPSAVVIMAALMMSGADKTFSVRIKRKYGSAMEYEYATVLPQRVLSIALTLFYVILAVDKFTDPMWRSGVQLWSNAIGARDKEITSWIARQRLPLATFNWFAYLAKAFGVMLPVCAWVPSVRIFFFFGVIIMHILSGLFAGAWWTLALAPIYILFIDPEVMMKKLVGCGSADKITTS